RRRRWASWGTRRGRSGSRRSSKTERSQEGVRMPRAGLVVALACAGCFVSPVIPLGSGPAPARTPAEAQARAARNLLPVDLIVPDAPVPPAHTFHARVWVDAGFRQRPHWRAGVGEERRPADPHPGGRV